MPKTKIHRRACLKGLGGITLALPTLEAMLNGNGTAHADGTPLTKRYVVCFGGYSIGNCADSLPLIVPDREGADYDLKMALEPFAGGPAFTVGGKEYASVKDDISVVTGLLIRSGPKDMSDPS